MLAAYGAGLSAWAASSWQTPVAFAHTWDTGPENALFVVGAANELGAWNPAQGVRLAWTSGNVWTGNIALPAGGIHEFKYVRRSMVATAYGDAANAVWMPGGNLAVTTAPPPSASYAGKTIYYHSTWDSAGILYRCGGTQWLAAAMAPGGPGRWAGEKLFVVSGVGSNDLPIEFVLYGVSNGMQQWDNAPYEGPAAGQWNYHTPLDVFWVQDKHLFNYPPPASPSAPRMDERWVESTVVGITARTIRIYLPRGYTENTHRRYPVLYMQDGQELFCGDTPRDDQWNADYLASREISQGRVRECIIVGMDNTPNRRAEYEPPGDRYIPTEVDGKGDAYLRFVMDNVRPTLDWNYRTRTDARHTLIGGSSMGGLISIYFGYATNVFGGVLAMSPAMTRATNFTAALWQQPRRDLRIYCDTGNNEGQVGPAPGGDYWYKPWEAYAIFLRQGYVVNHDLLMRVGCGAVHHESAWAARFPEALGFLLDVWHESNLLAQAAFPPRLQPAPASWTSPALNHFRYVLDYIASLTDRGWQTNQVSHMVTNPWGQVTFPGPFNPGFYRLRAEPAP